MLNRSKVFFFIEITGKKDSTLEIKSLPLSKLKPAKYNPRKDLKPDDPEYIKLKKSILEFDLVEPIVWNKKTGNVIGGHQRLKILKELKKKTTNCVVVNLDPTKEVALNLALNKISGEWDYPKLKDLLIEIDTGSFDIEITGFDNIEMADLFGHEGEILSGAGDDNGGEMPVIKLNVPDKVWFDMKAQIESDVTRLCKQYGMAAVMPAEPKKTKKQRF